MNSSPYHPVVLHSIPRLLTNLDRDPDSPTYGCFDRNYWHYKICDYSSAILQQSVLTLALVYSHNFEGNDYYNNDLIREYAIAGIEFWRKIQYRDGSFDEYWKREHSLPSTAFSLYAVCEASDLLAYCPGHLRDCIGRSVQFLEKNKESGALNQEMVSIAALRYAARILGNEAIAQVSRTRFRFLLARQNSEGWFPEYGGLDISYLTVTLDYLIRYYELDNDPYALIAAKKIPELLKFFVHPDGSTGGEYGSRNSEYFLPYGFEYLKGECDSAHSIVSRLTGYINQPMYLNTVWDERYLIHYLSHSFVKALLIYKEGGKTAPLPYEDPFFKFFEDAQIVIKSTDSYYCICSLAKGGIFKVIDKKSLSVSTDCGFRLKSNTSRYVTEYPRKNAVVLADNEVCVTTPFLKVKSLRPSGLTFFLIRVGSMFFGSWMRILVKKIIMFSEKEMSDMKFSRRILFADEKIMIDDTIDSGNRQLDGHLSSGFSTRYFPSSMFFQINSINNKVHTCSVHDNGKFTLHRELDFS
jgi:hypothetical protein